MALTRRNIIILGILFIILIQVLVYVRVLPGRKAEQPPSADLTFWGFQDDADIWREVFKDFQTKYPGISIAYTHLDAENYDETLLNKIAEGKGPDIFMLPTSLLLKYKEKIYPFPQQALAFSARDFSSIFVDGTAADLVSPNNDIFGFPLFIDTPVLFYNKDMFNAAGIAQAPRNWDEVIAISRQLTEKNAVGEIVKSGLPIGTYRNVDNAFEIISSLMLQEGDPIINPAPAPRVVLGDGGVKGLALYTSFADPLDKNFSWSNRLPDSLTAFAQGTSVFAIGFFDDIARVRAINPHINLGIAPFPQKKGASFPVVFGRYSFPTVSKFTQNPLAAWQFVNYITRDEGASTYLKTTNRPPARRDLLASGKAPIPELDTFYRQALIAKAWPMPDSVATQHLFEEAINSIVSRTTTSYQAVQNMKQRLDLLLPH